MTEAKPPVLVVDDEPEILYSLRGLLRLEFEVHSAESGNEAFEILRSRPIHVVMTDQRMPEMTGVEFLRRIREEHPDAVRLVFTGYADMKAVIDAINQGNVYRYITKPWDPEELLLILHQACDHYDRLAERRRLLADVRGSHARSLAFVEALRNGRLGTLNDAGRSEAEALAGAERALLESLDGALAPSPRARS